ncbi:hypothetical protein NE237_029681 [Protea cynaroides]|uniref:C2H2-type domain-containing protein n=1 Tax=Protea cynaroides TaxID=273540 RepID=A0A9Q0JU46_9MAGN|nr:hypothetical protein NE237_029681 [Protea cynaroides]
MTAHLSLLSIIHLQKLSQPQKGSFFTDSWMWNPRQSQEDDDDDSWEVRAFAEDAANIMGTTWPPRSYTCTFCRREFRSAQALGGHMNVHRRDRARLRQLPTMLPPTAAADPSSSSSSSSSSCTSSSTFIIPTPEFLTNCGCCLFYPLPNPTTNVFTPTPMESPSLGLTISPYLRSTSILAPGIHTNESSLPVGENKKNSSSNNNNDDDRNKDLAIEELDLELRLGQKPSQ